VLLPAQDAAATLARAIASIRAQTFPDWELLVVDDGSADGSVELLGALARVEPRLRVLRRPREGLVSALNAGLAATRGELIARMDADDEALPDRLAQQVAWLDGPAGRAFGLVSCLVEHAGDAAAQAGYARHVAWLNGLLTPEAMALRRFVDAPVAHPSVLFRRELVARHGGYRAGDFPEDHELWLRWMDAGVAFGKVRRVLLRWHDPPGRLSRSDARYAPEAFFRLKAEWIARWLRARPALAARPLLVWGAGRPTRLRAAALTAHGLRIAAYVDVDPAKVTPALGGSGLPVLAPAALPAPGKAFVLAYVSSPGARDLIAAELTARGWVEGHDFLLCA
jgi:glycosyltransferase involved in cell wall biosynthesis